MLCDAVLISNASGIADLLSGKKPSNGALLEDSAVDEEAGDDVWIQVARRAPVLVVATLVDGHHAADADAAATVCDAEAEVVH